MVVPGKKRRNVQETVEVEIITVQTGLANDLTVAILTMVTITITVSWDVIILCFARNVSRKVKQSRNKPGVAQRVPGGLGCQIFMTFST